MEQVLRILETDGPVTGKEMLEKTDKDSFEIWKYCVSNPSIDKIFFGRRYLRLDHQVEGYARQSPSILREFLSYTVLALKNQTVETGNRIRSLHKNMERISREKRSLAREILVDCLDSQGLTSWFDSAACALIAGDVVYGMAHREQRPEFSTGRCVNGSDLDIVIVTESSDHAKIQLLDSTFYQKKYALLTNPSYLEEIDYLIKDTAKVAEQLKFDDFKAMVACKIMHEGQFLAGSRTLFEQLKNNLDVQDIPGKLNQLEQVAEQHRQKARESLLAHPGPLVENELIQLFYTTMESEEFY